MKQRSHHVTTGATPLVHPQDDPPVSRRFGAKELALELLQQAWQLELQVSTVTYNAAISACERLGATLGATSAGPLAAVVSNSLW